MCFESKSEYNPMDKSNEIFDIVKKYSPTAHMISGDDFKYIKAVNLVGNELYIDIDNKEITLFFGNWHDHYYNDLSEYELFIENLTDIFNNRKFTVSTFLKDRAGCAFLSETAEPDIISLREEVGTDKTILCSFWNSSKNITFDVET